MSSFSSFSCLHFFFVWSPKKQKLKVKSLNTIVDQSVMRTGPYIFFWGTKVKIDIVVCKRKSTRGRRTCSHSKGWRFCIWDVWRTLKNFRGAQKSQFCIKKTQKICLEVLVVWAGPNIFLFCPKYWIGGMTCERKKNRVTNNFLIRAKSNWPNGLEFCRARRGEMREISTRLFGGWPWDKASEKVHVRDH